MYCTYLIINKSPSEPEKKNGVVVFGMQILQKLTTAGGSFTNRENLLISRTDVGNNVSYLFLSCVPFGLKCISVYYV